MGSVQLSASALRLLQELFVVDFNPVVYLSVVSVLDTLHFVPILLSNVLMRYEYDKLDNTKLSNNKATHSLLTLI